jgi:hypothetical protein
MPTTTISRCGGGTPLTLDQVIVGLQPDFWYKQGESSGSTAHDATGNGWDATVQAGFTAPTWGQPAGPPGTTAAQYPVDTKAVVENTAFPSLSGDFTLFTYVYMPTMAPPVAGATLMGQGAVGGQTAGQVGTSLVAEPRSSGQVFAVFVGNSGGAIHAFAADSMYSLATWYAVAYRRSSGVWNIYVNGVKQTGSYTEGVYSPAPGGDIWLGDLPSAGTIGENPPILSYSMGWGSRALTDAQILTLSTTLP